MGVLFTVQLALQEPPLVQAVGKAHAQHAHAVFGRAGEVDGGGFLKVFGGAGHLANLKAGHEYLGDHLIVKDKVVGIVGEVYGADDLGGEGAVAGVVFGELLAEEDVFKKRQHPVEDVLVHRHAAAECAAAEDAGGEHDGIYAVGDDGAHGQDELRGVLVIRVHHDDDVGTKLQRFCIAGFLIAAVAAVHLVNDDMANADALGHLNGIVGAFIVHEHYLVHHVHRYLAISALQRERGAVSGEDDDYFFTVEHGIN